MKFGQYMNVEEGLNGYILSSLMGLISEELVCEGRKDRQNIASKDYSKDFNTLFGQQDPEEKIDKWVNQGGQLLGKPEKSCPKTPLSGYARHIQIIQNFAKSSHDNFAQVLMFSPLSANVPFAKHWDNYYALMLILKHYFPKSVTKEQIEKAVDSFGDKYHALAHTIAGFKLNTIADIWSERENLFKELNALASTGDDVALIKRLSQIKGVQPVKAGFITQLIWGRAGCIDTHNIDIYSKVFPDLDKVGEFEEKNWTKKKGGVERYVKLLDTLNKRGIGTQQLWDVWVDFVESMYIMITSHGRGYYDMEGGSLDPTQNEFDPMKDIRIPKRGIGRDAGGVMVPIAKGKVGMGASSTHVPMEPDDALKQFWKKYRMGQIGSDAARSVAFHKDKYGRPMDQNLGVEPSALHYFAPALTGSELEVDPDHVRHIIQQRIDKGGKKARKKRWDYEQGRL